MRTAIFSRKKKTKGGRAGGGVHEGVWKTKPKNKPPHQTRAIGVASRGGRERLGPVKQDLDGVEGVGGRGERGVDRNGGTGRRDAGRNTAKTGVIRLDGEGGGVNFHAGSHWAKGKGTMPVTMTPEWGKQAEIKHKEGVHNEKEKIKKK